MFNFLDSYDSKLKSIQLFTSTNTVVWKDAVS